MQMRGILSAPIFLAAQNDICSKCTKSYSLATRHVVIVPLLTVRNVNKDYERNEECF